jgi:Uncharacterized protein conserved in bacteria
MNNLKKSLKRILLIAILTIIGYLIYSTLNLFVSPDRNIQQIYLIPDDAAFIIQASNPVDDWKKFSNGEVWKTLKQTSYFKEIALNAEILDSIINSNKNLLSLVGKRDLLLSIHKVRATDWDALMVLDMQKISKVDLLKDQIELILKMTDLIITYRDFEGIPIIEMRDPETRKILYTAFVENHFIASYTSKLVEASIRTRNNPKIGLDYSFIEAERLVSGKGLSRIFINYSVFPAFLNIYFSERNEYIDIFCQSMDYAGFHFNSSPDKLETAGYSFRKETADPYVTALLNSGKHSMKAHKILSARTAFYSNFGFNDPNLFVRELEKALSVKNEELYSSYSKSKKKIENWLDISLEEHFLSWMSGEFALTQSEPGLLGQEPELILAIKAKSMKDARNKMEFIEKKVKSKTPVSVKTANYKNFEIKYIEIKGFFRLFFGGIFDKFEKPYYTFIDDYVVFSNKPASLLSFIEDYDQKNLLTENPEFKKALSYCESNSTLFLFADTHKFYPLLLPMLNPETRKEYQANKDILYSFPSWSMQIVGAPQSASIKSVIDYEPYVPIVSTNEDVDELDNAMDVNADTEKKQMSELKRFYVEKFQGNVLREFYPEGALKKETEIKDGKYHGRYREYYENGKMKVRGKYKNNEPKGTWKYYTEEGKFERKEKF